MSLLTKKITLIFSVVLLTVPISMILIQETCNYNAQGWCWENWSIIGSIGKTTLWPSILFFATTLIIYPLRSAVFEVWKKFAVWALPVVIFLTYLITDYSGGGGFFTMDFSIYFLAIVYGLFFLTSLIIIVTTNNRNK